MELLKGAPAAKLITAGLKEITEKAARSPKLCIFRLGAEPEDLAYEKSALKRMEKAGIDAEVRVLERQIANEDFLREIDRANADEGIDGILVFRPLPPQIDVASVQNRIDPEKDVDCLSPVNTAKVFEGSGIMKPCTAQAVMEILKCYHIDVSGRHAVVVGRSMVVGKPLAMLLLAANATVTVCHSKTEKLKEICGSADILIAAAGRARMITADYVKEGAVVIDVGINTDRDGNLCGDTDFDSVKEKASALTPVPGGVGAVTAAVLAKQTAAAYELRTQR